MAMTARFNFENDSACSLPSVRRKEYFKFLAGKILDHP